MWIAGLPAPPETAGIRNYEMALHFLHWVGVRGPKKSWTSIPILQLKSRIRWYEVLLVDTPLSGRLNLHLYPAAMSWNEIGFLFPYSQYWRGPARSWTSTLGSGNRQEEGEWSSTCWQTTFSTRVASVGLDGGWGAELLAPLRGQTRWFKVALVNMPLSLHLWCQCIQNYLSLYPHQGSGR